MSGEPYLDEPVKFGEVTVAPTACWCWPWWRR